MISSLLRRRLWLLLLLLAVAFLGWTQQQRRQHLDTVTAIGREESSLGDPRLRHLIVPEHLTTSYEWLIQTQQMLEQGDLRIRSFDGDNAPYGRPVHAASPYRWWLGLVAAVDHQVSGRSWGAAVEQAARWADPLLQLALLVALSLTVARFFGAAAAAVVILAQVALFPFAAAFLPGVPDDFALFLALAPWSVLPLALSPRLPAERRPRCFLLAGIAAGMGLWMDVTLQVPLLVGVGLGALLTAVLSRGPSDGLAPLLWRHWGLGGGAMVLLGYVLEYFPHHGGEWEWRAIHPLYGIAFLGGAEVLAQLTTWLQERQPPRRPKDAVLLVAAAFAAASVPLAMWYTGNIGFLNANLLSFRLTKQIDGVIAPNLLEWLESAPSAAPLLATLLPVLLVLAAAFSVARRSTPRPARQGLALLLGPLLVAIALGGFHLRWWQLVGALLLVMLAVQATLVTWRGRRAWPLAWALLVTLCLGLGVARVLPRASATAGKIVSLPEVEGLVERDLAHLLVKRVGDGRQANVLAPPSLSATLHYYAGLRGLASLSWENKDGLSVALRMVISSSREEAHALVLSRGVTHIILPSWDPFYETYTRPASVQTGELFLNSLQRWVVPMWLRPIPYQVPQIGGFENQSVTIFEVVEEQEPAVGMSRITEYFIEMGESEAARAAGENLRRYPADFSALVARAQLEASLNDGAAFAASLETILQRLDARADRLLPWDRRVSLAVVLARGNRLDLARPQIERCLRDLTEPRLRALTPYALFHFEILRKTLELPIEDPALRDLPHDLLPTELRQRL